jgi:molybdopterin-guanine dinucleotide biosynthesis protein MobB
VPHTHQPGTLCSLTVVRVCGSERNVGKTTLATRLIEVLRRRGWDVVAIKRSHHALLPDRAGSDSDRMTRAGAVRTLYVAADGIVERTVSIPPLSSLLERLAGHEVAIVEGYRDEVIGARFHLEGPPPATVHVTNEHGDEITRIGADQPEALADLIEQWHGRESGPPLRS